MNELITKSTLVIHQIESTMMSNESMKHCESPALSTICTEILDSNERDRNENIGNASISHQPTSHNQFSNKQQVKLR